MLCDKTLGGFFLINWLDKVFGPMFHLVFVGRLLFCDTFHVILFE
jgi:hypothetical protein